MAVYFATKAFVLSLTEALHEELKPHGINVTCLCPGPTRTEFGDVAGFGGNGLFDRVAMNSPEVVEAGLDGLDKNKAVVVPGLVNKVDGGERPLCAALAWFAKLPGRSNIEQNLKPRRCAAVAYRL